MLSLCSVLAQFGGVALAFAFLATVGLNGVLTLWVQQAFGWNLAGSGWLYSLGGLTLVYTYFQIPLMVIVFLPALVVPIPLIARARAAACKGLADQLRTFIVDEPDV